MKAFTKAVVIFSSIFIFVGFIALITAIVLGGRITNLRKYEVYEFTNTYSDITSLDIQIGVGEVIIKKGNEFKIEATDVIKDGFISAVDNGVWTIKDDNKKEYFFDFIFKFGGYEPFTHDSQKIVIYVPENTNLEKFNITIGAGKGTIENIITKEINANIGTGELIIDNLNSERSDIDCGAGRISINGKMTGNNKIDCGVGNIELYLTGKEKEYNYKYDVGIGEFTINDKKQSGSVDGTIDNKASNSFDIDCGMGNVSIKIEE